MCCSNLEMLFINCKPLYSPREFCSFILVSVYNPLQAHVSSAIQKLADLITDTEQQHPDSVLIILGDFNKANLSRELPKYSQHITCPTTDNNILDHSYSNKRCISLCWNDLPTPIRNAGSLSIFKQQLKTHFLHDFILN